MGIPLKQISVRELHAMLTVLAERAEDILLSARCRRNLAMARWEQAGKPLTVHSVIGQGVMPGTVAHNRRELEENGFNTSKRTQRLISPLSSLDPVYEKAAELQVLSIGPRTEMELLHLVGVGFRPKNIHAVDLISSSDWIDLGDMHSLPYLDRAFDIVISSWVLNYSNDPQRAVDEMIRVCVPGGLIAIGVTHDPHYEQGFLAKGLGQKDIIGSMQTGVADLVRLLGNSLEQICFQQDPLSDDVPGPVMLITRVKR